MRGISEFVPLARAARLIERRWIQRADDRRYRSDIETFLCHRGLLHFFTQDSLGRAIGINIVTAKFRHVSFGATENISANYGMRSERLKAMAKILHIEDNEDNIYMVSRRLQRKGYEVLIAHDGAEGLAQAKSRAPALILVDLGLPVIDGWEVTRQLRAAPETAAVAPGSARRRR